MTIAQQPSWHTTIDQGWDKQAEVDLPTKELKLLRAHFQMNLDKECVMGSNGRFKLLPQSMGRKYRRIWMIIAVELQLFV